MDLSQYLLGLHKIKGNNFGIGQGTEAVQSRINNMNQQRRTNRHDLIMMKRNLSDSDMNDSLNDAVATKSKSSLKEKKKPTEKKAEQKPEEEKVDRRRIMLQKWKQQKELRKQQNLEKRKPVFKVAHAVGFPKVNEALQTIKGKDIGSAQKLSRGSSTSNLNLARSTSNLNLAKSNSNLNLASNFKRSNSNLQQSNSNLQRSNSNLQRSNSNLQRSNSNLNMASNKNQKSSQMSSLKAPADSKSNLTKKKLSFLGSDIQEKENKKKAEEKTKVVASKRGNTAVKPTTKVGSATKKNDVRTSSVKNGTSSGMSSDKRTASVSKSSVVTQGMKRKTTVVVQKKKSVSIAKGSSNSEYSTPRKPKLTTPHPKKKAPKEEVNPSTPNSSLSSTPNNNSRTSSISNSSPSTPNSKNNTPPVYVSPFVTISRGKNSARKEFHSRKSGDFSDDLNSSTGPKAGAAYFRFILENEIEKLQEMCNVWTQYKDENTLPDGAPDMIDVAIGQTQLLINKKFEQFRGLIDSCEQQTGEKPVTCEDLHGFWDMVYIQVGNLEARFENLTKMKENNWEEIMPKEKPKPANPPKKRGRPPKKAASTTTSSLRDAIKAARAKVQKDASGDTNSFDGGFFKIDSPQKTRLSTPLRTESVPRKSLLSAVLITQNNRRASAIFNATQSAKKLQNEGLPEKTPGKSILKTDRTKSSARKSRVVFFDDDCNTEDDKENVEESSNKHTPRRSDRLSKRTLSFEC